ncbi:hypothetical protein EV379_3125 [Microterricola gilva]|uniref:Uncharacterized protein n=1 Tax=Microterricola gilva TaxID=393267 RepID=A0A4Q8ARY4_9MICO|nr:hypothetical protein [Microterricola gilva]RZU66759.1 hypothetical protein EV379_3125 [Microterricola gilva]
MSEPLVIVDSSACSHVVACSVCHGSWVFLSKTTADEEAQAHRLIERLAALPMCSEVGCKGNAVTRGVCRPHYDARRYQERKAPRG